MAPIAAQAVVVILVMLPFGFELYPAGAVLGLLMLAIFGVGIGSLSYALALAVRKQEWMFWLVQQTLVFPLMILSGMLLPSRPARVDARRGAPQPADLRGGRRALALRGRPDLLGRRLGLGGRCGDRRRRAGCGDPDHGTQHGLTRQTHEG
ncbi:hypothetical protein NKG05_13635 [Oerskovia sp. M15]